MTRTALLALALFALAGRAAAQVGHPPASPPPPVQGAPRSLPASTRLQDLVRLEGQGRSELRGLGIVVGLRATGDSGAELALARPLAEVYRNNGNPIADLAELAKGKSAALVQIRCEIPREGALRDDPLDITVSVSHSASSLEGGVLLIAPLMGPFPGDPVYAMAAGPIVIEDPRTPTVGRIVGGAQMIQDVRTAAVGDVFNLIVEPHSRGWTTTSTIANQLNNASMDLEDDSGLAEPVARAIDDTTVRVTIPADQRSDPANFLASILSMPISPTLLDLPAQVIVNRRTGSIVVTGDVDISPVAVEHKNLAVTITDPPPVATPANPVVRQETWVGLQTTGRASERVRVEDLLETFKQLDVPTEDQIELLRIIHRTGHLHARLIFE